MPRIDKEFVPDPKLEKGNIEVLKRLSDQELMSLLINYREQMSGIVSQIGSEELLTAIDAWINSIRNLESRSDVIFFEIDNCLRATAYLSHTITFFFNYFNEEGRRFLSDIEYRKIALRLASEDEKIWCYQLANWLSKEGLDPVIMVERLGNLLTYLDDPAIALKVIDTIGSRVKSEESRKLLFKLRYAFELLNSDEEIIYLLQNSIGNFSDDEVVKFKDRFLDKDDEILKKIFAVLELYEYRQVSDSVGVLDDTLSQMISDLLTDEEFWQLVSIVLQENYGFVPDWILDNINEELEEEEDDEDEEGDDDFDEDEEPQEDLNTRLPNFATIPKPEYFNMFDDGNWNYFNFLLTLNLSSQIKHMLGKYTVEYLQDNRDLIEQAILNNIEFYIYRDETAPHDVNFEELFLRDLMDMQEMVEGLSEILDRAYNGDKQAQENLTVVIKAAINEVFRQLTNENE